MKKYRKKFNQDCLNRDKNKCLVCGYKPKDVSELDVHHITPRKQMPNGGYVKENGITLCCDRSKGGNNCHLKAEKHFFDKTIEGFRPEDLYNLINSNKELAIQKSLELDI